MRRGLATMAWRRGGAPSSASVSARAAAGASPRGMEKWRPLKQQTTTTTTPSGSTTTTTTADNDERELERMPSPGSGGEWIRRRDPATKREFWYNSLTMESTVLRPMTDLARMSKPQYATSWSDARFPSWVQFLEVDTRRPYYMNRETGNVQWTPPGSDPGLDIFAKEIEAAKTRFTRVPADAAPAPLLRRAAATVVDMGLSMVGGVAFAVLVALELGRPQDALASVPFAAWGLFLIRDAVIESGTRSIGKRLLKLEIVRWNGTLPSRFQSVFRHAYIPVYGASSLLMPYIVLLPIVDVGLVLFTPNAWRVGDVMALTRVIAERPDRALRLEEKRKHDAIEAGKVE